MCKTRFIIPRMDLPGLFQAHTSSLWIYGHQLERVRVVQSYLLAAAQRPLNSVVVAGRELIAPLEHVVYHTGIASYVELRSIDEEGSSGSGTPADPVEQIRAAVHERDRKMFLLAVELMSKRIVAVNTLLLNDVGRSQEELLGKNILTLADWTHRFHMNTILGVLNSPGSSQEVHLQAANNAVLAYWCVATHVMVDSSSYLLLDLSVGG